MEPEKLPPPDPAPSLAERLGTAARRAPAEPGRHWRQGVVAAILLPVLAVGVTTLVNQAITREIVRAAGVDEAADPIRAERRAIVSLGSSSFAATLDRVTRLLPPEARLQSLEVDRQDTAPRLLADIATADPDRLRAALSRSGGAQPLRVVNERRGDGVMIVSVEGRP